MAEQWFPGATRNPGVNAGFAKGRVRKQCVKMHYTVGVNSTPIGLRGFFQWLISRQGHIQQFAEADAICWDSGEWNDAGPGIELEYYEPKDGPHPENIVTPDSIAACGKLIHWLHTEHGYPLDFYDGPRIAESSGFRGFITHRSLVQTERHVDYITNEQWNRMIQGVTDTPKPQPEEEIEMGAVYEAPGGAFVLCRSDGTRTNIVAESAAKRQEYVNVLAITKQIATNAVPKVGWEFLGLWRPVKHQDEE